MKNFFDNHVLFSLSKLIKNFFLTLKLFFLILFLLHDKSTYSQSYCGAYIDTLHINDTINSIVVDRFGNHYKESDLLVPINYNREGCGSVFIIPIVEMPLTPTLEGNVKIVACNVAEDLENLISTTYPNIKVNVHIVPAYGGLPPGAIAAGTQFYPEAKAICQSINGGASISEAGTVENLIQHGIALQTSTGSLTFAASIRIDPSVNWSFDGTFTGTQYDLYTTLMHEMFHCLGIASGIAYANGDPAKNYTKYDLFLKADGTNLLADNLSNDPNSGTCGCKIDNVDISKLVSCQVTFDNFIKVWSDNSQIQDKLSHFYPSCDSKTYLMNWEIPSNTQVTYDNDELLVLCDLGYTIHWPSISIDCSSEVDNCYITTSSDYFTNYTTDNIDIQKSTLLLNDFNATDIIFIGAYNYGGPYTITPIIVGGITTGWNISGLINSSLNKGFAKPNILYYVATGCSGECEYGFIYIYQFNETPNYPDCPSTPNELCGDELNCMFDFESLDFIDNDISGLFYAETGLVKFNPLGINQGGNFNDVDIVLYSTPIPNYDPANHAIAMANYYNDNGIYFPLANAIPPRCTVNISLKVSQLVTGTSQDGQTSFSIYGADSKPCLYPNKTPLSPNGQPNCDDGSFHTIQLVNNQLISDYSTNIDLSITQDLTSKTINLEPFNFQIENTTNFPISHIIIYTDQASHSVLFDDIHVTSYCPPPTVAFTVLNGGGTICAGQEQELNVQVCANNFANQTDADMSLTLQTLPTGLTYVSGDLAVGTSLNTNFMPGECKNYNITVEAGSTPGSHDMDINYDVTGYCDHGTGTGVIPITIEGCVPNDAEFTYIISRCTNSITVYFTSVDQNGTHYWDFGNGSTSTEANPSTTYSTMSLTGNFIISHTITINGTPVTTTHTITFKSATQLGYLDISAGGGTRLLSDLVGNGSFPDFGSSSATGHYILNGTLNIDIYTGYNFNNMEILLGPDARIVLLEDAVLNITNCYFHSCNALWLGIQTSVNSLLSVSESTRIEDAKIGIDIDTDIYSAEIKNSIFNRNILGIKVEPSTGGIKNVFLTDHISECKFTCTHALNSYYVGGGDPTRTKGYAGIELNNCMVQIGLPAGCLFDGLVNGVLAYSSYVGISNSTFSNMTINGSILDPIRGTAIYGEGDKSSSINVMGLGHLETSSPTILNVDYGVRTLKSNCTVTNSLMRNVNNGVDIRGDLPGINVSVTNNLIYANAWGIANFYANGIKDGYINIRNNRINMGTTTALASQYGIVTANYNSGKAKYITDNIINVDYGFGGLFASSENKLQIRNNTVNLQNTINTYGYRLLNTNLSNIIQNNSNGHGKAYDIERAYYMNNCQANIYQCNTAAQSGSGYVFENNCDATQWLSNLMQQHLTGLSIINGLIGNQFFVNPSSGTPTNGFDNRWLGDSGDYTNFAALNSSSGGLSNASHLIVPNPQCTKVYPCEIDINPVDLITGINAPYGLYNCTDVNPRAIDPFKITNFDRGIVLDTIDFARNQDGNYYNYSRVLFDKLSHDPLINLGASPYQTWYNSRNTDNMGAFHDIEQGYSDIIHYNALYADTLLIIDTLINTNDDSIRTLISALPFTASGTPTTNLRNHISIIASNNVTLINHSQTIVALLKTQLTDDLGDLYAANDGITASNDAETNEKQVNEMYMRICFDGPYILDTLEWDTMYAIANQCPETGGRAVYEARTLLLLNDVTVDFDDETLCDPPAPKPLAQKEAIAGDLLVYPNPFHDEFTVQFIGENTKKRNINLIGIDGRIIAQYILPNGQNKLIINTNPLMSGLYIIRMTSDDGIKIQKLIKQ